jgi:hypothetical protein
MGYLKLPQRLKVIKNEFDNKLNVIKTSKQVLSDNNPIVFSDMKLTFKMSDGTKYVIDLEKELMRASEILASIDNINKKVNYINGIDTKSIGYLYGGYKGGNAIDHLQRFNTLSETSADIYTTGKKVRYVPGITTMDNGYFTWEDSDNTWKWSKFDFNKEHFGETLSSSLPSTPQVSAYNMGVGDTALTVATKTWIFKTSDETFKEVNDTTLNNMTHTTRQALNNKDAAFIIDRSKDSPHYIFVWETQTVTTDSSHIRKQDQYATGLSKDKGTGYWVDKTTLNKVKYDGKDILSIESMDYPFKPHYGESHSLQGDKAGYMMAGYDDNIGDFGGGQHGYVSRLDWVTETAKRLANLAKPQSSGEMVQR